ncbi:acyclic terpene utilization AtuA family protein [Streptomyces sp. NPDC058441]|uniref:acyclic terpene utilization AtuA family protein n=1 Tax=Streptomyces sp. NPDC058441 TaxID=3346502 RepID=UPI00366391EC
MTASDPSPLRIANCSGFYGDRLSAAREMVEGGPIDVLTGDWLAELTMLVLHKDRQRRPGGGFARTFVQQLEGVLGTCAERGVRIVSNAGGLNPQGAAEAVRALADRLGIPLRVATVTGDDLTGRLGELAATDEPLTNIDTGEPLAALGRPPITANAYLGGSGIAAALRSGADVVITGRVTDAALVVGPGMWRFGWDPGRAEDLDALAGAVAAGHVIECGCQATGGNYSFFQEVPDLANCGFPLTELHVDGSSVITKHPGTGGLVSVGTVTAQLLYEIGSPHYLNPDAGARFDTLRLIQESQDRVRIEGCLGTPAPRRLKVAVNADGGYRNTMTVSIAGLDVPAKAKLAEEALWARIPGGRASFERAEVDLLPGDPAQYAPSLLRITVLDPDKEKVGRAFSAAVVETALATFPGYHTVTRPSGASSYGIYWPASVPARLLTHQVELDGVVTEIPAAHCAPAAPAGLPQLPAPDPEGPDPFAGEPTVRLPIGTLIGARSGDKGGNANLGLWARSSQAYDWLDHHLTTERLRELLPETAQLRVERYRLPNLLAVNFVIHGLLGRGVAANTRHDPQAKSLGEQLRARLTDIPTALLA